MAVDKALGRISYLTLIALMLIPVFFAVGPALESKYFPVVNKVVITAIPVDRGMPSPRETTYVEVSFDKIRTCKFEEVVWASRDGRMVLVQFEAEAADLPLSRPVSSHMTGPWVLGTSSIENTRAIVRHRCHPLWITESHFYP